MLKNAIIIIGGFMKKISILALHLGYGGIEKCISVLQEQVNVENHRIKDLEEVQHDCILKRGKSSSN